MHDDLTPAQVADLLGVTVRTVQRWVRDGRLPASRVGGRVRVPLASLAAVRSGAAQATDAPLRRPAAIRRLLVANRGEIASRIARTARRLGIDVVGVRLDDERPPAGIERAIEIPSYLDADAVLRAARRLEADAVHPGYGFLAENAAFADAVTAAGLTWIGPPAAAIAAMGDKAAARRRAAAAGVPVLPGYDGEAQDDETLLAEGRQIGVPLLVKPSAGGGGKGMRIVRDAAELPAALAAARREARRAFGDERLILERLVESGRHVEVQVLFDRGGRGAHLGERDCSTQRRHQKVIEEAPAPSVSADLRERMGAAALAVAASVSYVNAGTVEFLLADDGTFAFLEMNTRLQVEHGVTEAITGRDLVADQLRIAAGEPLPIEGDGVRLRGHAIEVRLYAEDPESGFLPATGSVAHLRWPEGPGIRVDAGIEPGDEVTDRYDPMLAKIIASASDRAGALRRLRDALGATELLGVTTNLRFLRWLLDRPEVVDGEVRTDTLDSLEIPAPPIPIDDDWAAAATALRERLPSGPWGGGWRLNAPPTVLVVHDGEVRRVSAAADVAGRAGRAVVLGDDVAHVDVEGRSMPFRLAAPPTVDAALEQAAAASAEHASLVAPMPGRVIAVRAPEGATVAAGATVVVIEAMKMEHAVVSPLAGRVTRLTVRDGDQVQRGDVLAEVSLSDTLAG